MKVGIFGGSFNPPHKMHKRIGLELIKKGYVDKIIYVPFKIIIIKKIYYHLKIDIIWLSK